MQLDVCPPGESAQRSSRRPSQADDAMGETRARRRRAPKAQALFGIVQGACFRRSAPMHAEELAALDAGFDGLALGGFSVGEPIERMHETLADRASALDAARPRYLMGVGTPRDLISSPSGCGIDMFDCVLPTRNARNGQALTPRASVVIKQARYAQDPNPHRSRVPVRVLRRRLLARLPAASLLAGEILVLRLLSLHNLTTLRRAAP
jgi:queuine tRNA-ribosyltransferase